MRILIVGAGSVGQAFGFFLRRAGHDVTFWVRKPPVVTTIRLYQIDSFGRRRELRPLELSPLLVDGRSVDLANWDQAYFCVPSDAIREGLVERLAPWLGGATLVRLQPGLKDGEAFARGIDPDQVVGGMVSFVAFSVPLPEEPRVPPGTAVWIPPWTPVPFSGPRGRTGAVVAALRGGGLPARLHPHVELLTARLLALQTPLTAALACAGGKVSDLVSGPWLEIGSRGVREAQAIVSKALGGRPSWPIRRMDPPLLRLALPVVAAASPFPLEKFLAAHHRKLSRQAVRHLDDYLEAGVALRQPADSLRELRGGLEPTGRPDPNQWPTADASSTPAPGDRSRIETTREP